MDDELYRFGPGCGEKGPSINSPVTIVEGGREGGPGRAPTINLEEYSDYVLRKFTAREEWGREAGNIPSSENMRYRQLNSGALPPLQAIGITSTDALYVFSASLVCKVPNGGAGTLTMTITYFDVVTGSDTITLTLPLTAGGKTLSGPTVLNLLAGSTVTVGITNSGTFSGATYDAMVGLQRAV